MMIFGRFSDAQEVVVDENHDVPAGTTGLYIGTGGLLILDLRNDDGTLKRAAVRFANIPDASLIWDLPIKRIRMNTTCGNMVALIGR